MITKLTVQEYATAVGISPTAVYKKIKNQSLEFIKEAGKTFIILHDNDQALSKSNDNECMKMVKDLLKENSKLIKSNKKLLNKALDKSDETNEVYKQFITMMLPNKKQDVDIEDTTIVKTKSKKKKSKK